MYVALSNFSSSLSTESMQLHLTLRFHKLPKSNTDAALGKMKSLILPRQVRDV